MLVRRSLLVLALALMVVRCADQPTAVSSVRAPAAPQFLRWAGSSAPDFSAISPQIQKPHGRSQNLTPPLRLDNYQVSFWGVRGETRSVQINYASSIDDSTHPFLRRRPPIRSSSPASGSWRWAIPF